MGLIHAIGWLIVGLISGGVTRFLTPGQDSMGCLMTIALGVVGAFVGGFIINLIFHFGNRATFHPGGIIMSIIGAIIALLIWRRVRG